MHSRTPHIPHVESCMWHFIEKRISPVHIFVRLAIYHRVFFIDRFLWLYSCVFEMYGTAAAAACRWCCGELFSSRNLYYYLKFGGLV